MDSTTEKLNGMRKDITIKRAKKFAREELKIVSDADQSLFAEGYFHGFENAMDILLGMMSSEQRMEMVMKAITKVKEMSK